MYVPKTSGVYELRRSTRSYTLETFELAGPLAVLGTGSTLSYRSNIVDFSPRSGVRIVFSRLPVNGSASFKEPLWSTATAYLRTRKIVATAGAAEELAEVVGDADDVLVTSAANESEYEIEREYVRHMIDYAAEEAERDSRAVVLEVDVQRARIRICQILPVWPICKKKR